MRAAEYERFEKVSRDERRGIFQIVADDFGIRPAYAEKDFWVCRVLDVLMREPPTFKEIMERVEFVQSEMRKLGA